MISKSYDYQPDGRIGFSHDLIDAKFDRSYAYDHAARITTALSGAEARNEGTTNLRPYKETFSYDALGHLTDRPVNAVWSGQGGAFQPHPQTYQNERNTAWQYDAAGNLTDSGNVDYTIDAAGQTSRSISLTVIPYNGNPYSTVWGITNDLTRSLDGDGAVGKQVDAETTHDNAQGDTTTTATTYLVRSSVLGGKVLTEISSETGRRGFVYLGNEVLAWQLIAGTTELVKWEHRDAGNASSRMTWSNGSIVSTDKAELDPLGTNAGTADPTTLPSLLKLSLYPGWGDAAMRGDTQCMWDGLELPCHIYADAINLGSVGWRPDPPYDPDNPTPPPGDPDKPIFHHFENAAEYGDDRVDPWQSPWWVSLPKWDSGRGDGFFAVFPQNPEQQRMTDARNDFKKRLEANKGKNPCAKLFGGLKKAEKALNKTANIFIGPPVDPNIGAITTGKNVAINPVGGFFDTSGSRTFQLDFNLRDKTAEYVVLGNVEAAAFILAHELGHVTGKLEKDDGDPFGFKSIWNNKKVYEACFSEIPSFTGPQR